LKQALTARAAGARLLDQGWIDAVRRLHPSKRSEVYTFWVDEAGYRRGAGVRMDVLLLSPGLAGRLERAKIDHAHRAREKPSDHAPVWVALDLNGR